MKKKSCTPSKTATKKYVLRKRPHTFNQKDFEKIFEDMKNQIIDGIKKAAENKINEQKEIFINYINTCEIIDRIQLPSADNPKKNSKNRNSSKKSKAGKDMDNLEPSSKRKGSKKSKSNSNTKIQKAKKGKSPSVKLNKKKNGKKKSCSPKEDKKDKECLIDISNMSSIVIKNNKMDKRKLEGNENMLIGKKRKREKEKEKEKEKENFVSIVLKSEPNTEEVESAKKQKKNNKQRKNNPKKKEK
jgi:hypothetical protein